MFESTGFDQSRRIQVNEPKFDMALNAELQNGLVLLSLYRDASGMVVQPLRTATVCEFEPVQEIGLFCSLAQTMDVETSDGKETACKDETLLTSKASM